MRVCRRDTLARIAFDLGDDAIDRANETDTGIGGVTLLLVDSNGQVVATTTTATDGTYTLINLLAGDYTVIETQPAAYGSSTVNSVPVTLAIGSTPPLVDFG